MPYRGSKKQKQTSKEWKKRNSEHISQYDAEYYKKNAKEINRKRREKRKNNAEYRQKCCDYERAYRLKNREKSRKWHRDNKRKVKLEVLTYYGNGRTVCVRCGEDRGPCLSIDHKNGGGRKHREETGPHFYYWLKRNSFPSGFQTLCMNCQFIKRAEQNEK